ncbi:indole-3-glycerol phosphate synthase TrpC [Niallia sp. NCCP-28]|uniref:indole-3-glycerol phosphate synthase TrpC n=1 Tax=Niallia sp. NCCP-28 TaxID=2934712 RepID=UPI002080D1EA|nr:indole-3-glycerol phosphate synthase TrpC [Niallia sp. NCCP-28]GKU80749.1 indole-3-glycerol phosphate synthase [Niallia sp. NCCP-28]
MGTILDKIIAEKHSVVEELKTRKEELETSVQKKQKYSFLNTLKNANTLSIIAEFKRASPSKGEINSKLDPAKQGGDYQQFGADAISVLTDTPFFKGTFEDLTKVRSAVELPILCKDFIIDPIQIDFAKHYGANLILLIVAALDDETLKNLYDYAIGKDLEVLVEVHDEAEAERAIALGASLIGVNNRNLKTFEVTLDTTERLAPMIKKSGSFLVSESGIATADDIRRVAEAGANAILVGETFMRSGNLEETLKQMKVSI